mgnify:FL=1
MTFSLHEAKAKLSELVSLAETGETIEITRHGKIVARLTGADFEPRPFGTGKGTVTYLAPFELTEEEIDDFYGPIEPE